MKTKPHGKSGHNSSNSFVGGHRAKHDSHSLILLPIQDLTQGKNYHYQSSNKVSDSSSVSTSRINKPHRNSL